VTVALRERLARERARRKQAVSVPTHLATQLAALSSRLRTAYDTRPVSRAEWDAASGDPG
jgi:hypothetical protein